MKMRDVLTIDGCFCIAMPKLKMSLDNAIEKKHLDRSKKVKIAHGLLSALCFLHDNSMIHRDVKSANVMLDEKWEAQLIDFSLAKLISTDQKSIRTHTPDIGTACYIAPEVYRKQPYGFKADAYSAGVVLLEMFSGEKLGTDRDKAAIMLIQKKKENLPGNDKPVPALLRSLLEEDPENRLTVREVLGDGTRPVISTIVKLWVKNKFSRVPSDQRVLEQALNSLVNIVNDIPNKVKKGSVLARIKKACSVLESLSELTERAAIRYAKSTEHLTGQPVRPEHCVLLAMKMNEDEIPELDSSIEALSYECDGFPYDIDEYVDAERMIFECMNYCLFVAPHAPKIQKKRK